MKHTFAYLCFTVMLAAFVWGCAHIADYSFWGTAFFMLIGAPLFAFAASPIMLMFGVMAGLQKTA